MLIGKLPKYITAAIQISMAAVIMPLAALAEEGDGGDIQTILSNTQEVLQIILAIVMTLAIIVFIWGIVKFIAAAGNPQKMTQAKYTILYGIIGIAVMATITGIIAFLQSYFGVTGGIPIEVPQF